MPRAPPTGWARRTNSAMNRITNKQRLSSVLLLGLASCQATTLDSQPVATPAAVVRQPFSNSVGHGVSNAIERCDDLTLCVEELLLALETGTLDGACHAYAAARAPYEEIQVLAAAFPELDLAIDGRSSEFEAGEFDPGFRGFHRIEILLFARKRMGAATPYARQLLQDVQALRGVLEERGRFSAAATFAGMQRRCMDVATRMVSSEEEMWSNQSLLVIHHAWIGCYEQYKYFAGAVRTEDALLAERIDRAYRKAIEEVAGEFSSEGVEGSPFTLIDMGQRRQIADSSLKLRGYLLQAHEALGLKDA